MIFSKAVSQMTLLSDPDSAFLTGYCKAKSKYKEIEMYTH